MRFVALNARAARALSRQTPHPAVTDATSAPPPISAGCAEWHYLALLRPNEHRECKELRRVVEQIRWTERRDRPTAVIESITTTATSLLAVRHSINSMHIMHYPPTRMRANTARWDCGSGEATATSPEPGMPAPNRPRAVICYSGQH